MGRVGPESTTERRGLKFRLRKLRHICNQSAMVTSLGHCWIAMTHFMPAWAYEGGNPKKP